MKRKFHYFLLFVPVVIFFTMKGFGQSESFVFSYGSDYDEVPLSAIETQSGDFIITARQGTWPLNNKDYHVLLIKINSMGDSIASRFILNQIGNCYLNTLISDSANLAWGIGSYPQSNTETSIWIVRLDVDLNTVYEKLCKTNCESLGFVEGFLDSAGNILVYGDGYTGPNTYYDLFIYKTTSGGDSLGLVFYPDPGEESSWSMIENKNSGKYNYVISGRYQINTNTIGQILTVSSDLLIEDISGVEGDLVFYYDILSLQNSTFLTGTKIVVLNPYEAQHLLGVQSVDTSFSIVSSTAFGSEDPDTVSFPGYINNLTASSSNQFYYGGTFNQDKDLEFSYFDSWLHLIRLDSELNVYWQKFYGGDMYYGLWGIKATSDGGCLLLGSTYDDQVQYNERDIIIIKVDSNGLVTSNGPDPIIQSHDAIVYPNPGSDYLIIASGPQIKGAVFRMFDMQGKEVLSTTLNETQCRLSTVNLSPGNYGWSIIYEGTAIETGKWILSK